VRRFSSDCGVPVLVTYKAKGVIADEDALFAGVFTNGAIERPLVQRADLILGVGLDPVELIPRPWRYAQPVVLCSAWPLHQRHIQPAIEIVGEVAGVLEDLQGAATRSAWSAGDLTPLLAAQRDAVRWQAASLAPHTVVEVVARACGEHRPRVTVDAGAHMFPATVLWPAREPRDLLISNGLSTMGFALPSAIGAALVEPERTVVAFTGDAGLLMCLAELGTAAREGLKVVVVIFNDRALSLIKIKQVEKAYAASGVDLGGLDWPAIGQGLGVPARRARTELELARAVQEAMDATGPFLIDVLVDPGGYGDMLRTIRG
jgi:acetolactate synthase-1/2/3 large subunit